MSATEEILSIPKFPKLEKSENYTLLRQEGIAYIQRLSSRLWTDYNTHDPGITILELLCYAITDLGYRTSYNIRDLLTVDPNAPYDIKNFYTAKDVLPVNPTTVNDLRKLIMDVPGIKNAWLTAAKDYEYPVYADFDNNTLTFDKTKGDKLVEINGLYNVLLEYEDEKADSLTRNKLKHTVRDKLHAYRNLCEDYLSITQVQYEDIAVCADIEVKPDADIEKVLAKIYLVLINYFCPPVNFYRLEEMLDKGKTVDEIFEGPLLESGFIDDEELDVAERRTELRVSDIINEIMDIEEVVAVKSILLTSYVNGETVTVNANWVLTLASKFHVARLSKEKSKFMFYKEFFPYIANKAETEKELKLLEASQKFRLKGHKRDIDVPAGSYLEPADFYPVQNEFPLNYGIGPYGLPSGATEERKAQAKQLKAYMMLYEQLLTNYLAQLSHVKELFSYNTTIDRSTGNITGKTYFVQELKEITGMAELLNISPITDYEKQLYEITENSEQFLERRNRLLDHLMARFCEEMTEYSLVLFGIKGVEADKRTVMDKEAFLGDYIAVSRDRGKAFNYKSSDTWDTSANVAGMKKRIARLLGMDDYKRKNFATSYIKIVKVGMMWEIQAYDPLDTTEILMRSVKYPDEECAESALLFMLAHGDNEEYYKVEKVGSKYYFKLLNDCDPQEIVATSIEESEVACRARLARTIQMFKEHADVEGFHVIEHLLLRPRTNLDSLLPVCLSKPEKTYTRLEDPYVFEIIKSTTNIAKPYSFVLRDKAGVKIMEGQSYEKLNDCTYGIAAVRDYGSEAAFFKYDSSLKKLLIVSPDNSEELARSSSTYATEDAAEILMNKLIRFLSFQEDIYQPSEQCDETEDPYSFRVTVVLPAWPERFRNITFRRHIEKTIRMETPAHIYPKVCWISLKQMRELELAYKKWLQSMAANAYPNPTTMDQFIKAMYSLINVYPVATLHSCDDVSGDEPQVILGYSSLGTL
jgi:hypothetical protein